VRPREGDDIHRSLLFTTSTSLSEQEQRRLAEATDRLRVGDFDRPWVGGVDTPHSYFYHDRYGPAIVGVITGSLRHRSAAWPGPHQLNGALVSAPAGHRLTSRSGVLAVEPAPGQPPERYFLRADGRLFRLPGNVHSALSILDRSAFPRRACLPGDAAHDDIWTQAVGHHLLRPAGQPGAIGLPAQLTGAPAHSP